MPQSQSRYGDGARRVHHEDHRDHEGWEGGIGCRIFACLAALRAGPDADWRFSRGFSQRRKVAKGVGASGLTRRREDHEGWEGGIGCRIFACSAALRAGLCRAKLTVVCWRTAVGLPRDLRPIDRQAAAGLDDGGACPMGCGCVGLLCKSLF